MRNFFLVAALMITAAPVSAEEVNCVNKLQAALSETAPNKKPTNASFVECLMELQTKINEGSDSASTPENSPMPEGAVVAFDRPQGCPDGWTDMAEQWRGRVVVAALKDANDKYGFGRIGGSETHTLTVEEMPRHSHEKDVYHGRVAGHGQSVWQAFLSTVDSGSAGGKARLPDASVGGGKPHNNMPPYVALFLCKKDG